MGTLKAVQFTEMLDFLIHKLLINRRLIHKLVLGLVVPLSGTMTVGCSSLSPSPPDTVSDSQSSNPSAPDDQTLPKVHQNQPQEGPTRPGKDSPQTNGRETPATDNTLVSKLEKDVEDNVSLSKQDVGKTYLGSILRSQQAEHLVSGKFATSLAALETGNPAETDEYKLQINQADQTMTVAVAAAKRPGLFSYTGVAYAVEASIPLTAICRTNEPSQTPPPLPSLVNKVAIVCPSGSTPVE